MSNTVYVLRPGTTGKIYIGQTSDLAKRIQEQNDPENRITLRTKRNPGPWEVVHEEHYRTRSEAMRREKALKSRTAI